MQEPRLYTRKLLTSITIGLIAIGFLASSLVIAPTPPANWWNIDWQYRKSLTIDHTKVASDLVDFPVLINLTDADLSAKAQIYGDDVVFADSDGQRLNHEIEFYNGTSGTLIAWVKIPILSSTVDTTIYMYYGNADAFNQENSEQVWDSNYMMTQHFSERYESVECRFWGMIAQSVLPQTVVLDHLINLPNSLKNLGATNPNGWGLAYYNNSQPTIRRGEPAANTDPNFDVAAQELASNGASIGMGHVRKSASPPYNIPDPHPFNRSKLGKWWTFGHHGVIDKAVLVQLIGDAYLAANPPQYGSNISEWNDSELYFIYILKCIEENSGNVRTGVAEAVTAISSHSSSYNMDFVFSDGTTLWAFRKGDSTHLVYYYYNSTFPQYAAVASQYPTSNQGSWVFMNNYNFVELTKTDSPLLIDDIRTYAPIDHFDSTSNNNDGVAHGGVVIGGEGKIDGGDMFDGVDDYVTMADNSTLDGDGNWQQTTVECWVKSTKDNQKATIILSKRETGTTPFNSSYQIGFDSAGNSQLFWGVYLDSGYAEAPYGTSPMLVTNQWYYVVGTFENPSIKLYVNGVLVSSASKSGKILSSDKTPLRIGCRGNSGALERFLSGVVDEVRISNVTRSSSWISTCYNNQNDSSTFYIVGEEETTLQPTMRIDPAATEVFLNTDCTIFVEIDNVEDLYAWEFQLNYNQTILDLTSWAIVPGGLNEPTYTFYSLIDEANGHVWFAVSTTRPTITGISYSRHAIFELQFHTMATGTSNMDLHGTIFSDSNTMPISHEVVDGIVTVSSGYADLGVTNISVLNHGCSVYASDTYVNGSIYYYPTEVMIHNSGATATGPFYVRLDVYWINGSLYENWAEMLVSGLIEGASVMVNFTSLFHPVHTGYYRLTATADSHNDVAELNETNNMLVLDNVPVAMIGDVNGDKEVNILDGVVLSLAWAATPSNPRWNIRADVNHDGVVDILDGVRVGQHWGATW